MNLHFLVFLLFSLTIGSANGEFDFLKWLEKFYGSVAPITTTTTLKPTTPDVYVTNQRPVTGGLLCGFNRYIDDLLDFSRLKQNYSGEARPNEVPWLVRIIDRNTYRWFCDGVIISNRAVLTTASCLDDFRRYQIVLADHKFGHFDNGETTIDVAKVVTHPKFDRKSKTFDFAIMFTGSKIATDKNLIRPICLHEKNSTLPMDKRTLGVFGWGKTLTERKMTLWKEQNFGKMALSNRQCLLSYTAPLIHQMVGDLDLEDETTICGAGDGCNADVGSPLIDVTYGRYYLVGLASTVQIGCQLGRPLPIVYSRVSVAVDWIENIINGMITIEEVPFFPTSNILQTTPMPIPKTTTSTLSIFRPSHGNNRPNTTISTTVISVGDISEANCGLTRFMNNPEVSDVNAISQRIVGGVEALIDQVPWQVRVLSRGYLCGGTIINRRMILTAAHCIESLSPTFYRVIAGDHSKVYVDDAQMDVPIVKVISHEGYDEDANRNDFAVLITKDDIPFYSWSIRPVCLPKNPSSTYAGINATISGWGKIAPGKDAKTPENLQVATVSIVSNSECSQNYRGNFLFDSGNEITEEMICARAPGRDTCQGDSGGPMTVIENGRHTLVGVTSFGRSCGNTRYPGVYARVTTILDWLEQIMVKEKLNF